MTKVAINRCYGGFSLSEKAFDMLLDRKGVKYVKVKGNHFNFIGHDYYHEGHVGDDDHYISEYKYRQDRAYPDLIAVIEELGEEANGRCAEIDIVEIPDDVQWEVDEYDGKEWVAEVHRTWY